MRLLLAEDEVELANALSAVLKHKNYSVDAVYNGIDAYNYAIAQDYDGIILDIMMPGMDGIQVLTKLREQGIDSPVLLLTAKSDIDDRLTTPTGKPVGFLLPSLACHRTSFTDFGIQV